MSIRLTCSACQKTLQVPDTAAGKKARCPSCKALNDVPASSATPASPAAAKPAESKPVATPKAAPAAPKAASAQPSPATAQNKSENIPISCTGCGKSFRAPKAAAGKTVKCPNCQGSISVPAVGGGIPASPKPAPVQSPRTAPQQDPFAMPAQSQGNSLWDAIGDAQSMQTASTPAWSQPAANPYAGPGNFGGGGGYSGGGYSGGGYASQSYRRSGRSPALYIIPAVFISLWGLLIVGGSVLRLVLTVVALTSLPPNATIDWARFSGFIIGMILGFILGLLQLAGGITMAMRSNLALARTAAFINAIPCFGVLTFPFGIWAAVLLTTGSVKKDFGE